MRVFSTPRRWPAVVLVLLALVTLQVTAQTSAQIPERYPTLTRIPTAEAQMHLDGVLDETAWSRVPAIDNMRVIQPDTMVAAPFKTESRIFYNSRGLYVGVKNYQDADTLVARMSSRDSGVQRDGYVIAIDPSGEGLYGYYLRINLGGTFSDGTILPEKQINRQWDGPWDAVAKEVEDGWIAEIFVPWSMMTLPASGETRRIGIYTERMVASTNEVMSWPALPDTNSEYLSAFQKYELSGVNPATQFTFYPYSSATFDDMKDETKYRVGADVYWRPTSNMQFSATLNPDFGTVESDDVVVNLGAFETFFEEKRAFFLEGQDVFSTSPRDSGGGFGPTTMLNTRRIGSQPDITIPAGVRVISTDLTQPTDLIGAVKFTGQSGRWRYGTLMASEDDSTVRGTLADGTRVKLEADGRDFTVGRLLYEDTSAGGRRSIGWLGTNLSHPDRDANVNGVDAHYYSADNRWLWDGQVMRSDVQGVHGNGGFLDVDYRPARGITHSITSTYLDDKLDLNDIGYVQRNDLVQLDYRFSQNVSNIEGLRSRTRSLNLVNQWNTDGRPVRLGVFGSQSLTFLDNNSLGTNIRYFPPRVDDRLSRGNGVYKIPERWAFDVSWRSDRSKPLSYNVSMNSTQEDLAKQNLGYNAGFNWRPNDRFTVDFNVRYIDREAWLIHQGKGRMTTFEANEWSPKLEMDYFINAKQQLRFSMQWTGIKAFEDKFYQADPNRVVALVETGDTTVGSDNFSVSRMSFQARYRWEIAPLSDLFFVYTRGSNLARTFEDDYTGMFEHAWSDQIVDNWVLKLRYRLGS